jgi:hypothetical protein
MINSDTSRGSLPAASILTVSRKASCKHCAKPVQWKKSSTGKFAPIEPVTGFDHRERCVGMSPVTKVSVRNQNHEAAVKGFFRSLGAPE